jgi:hypothetical protein
MSLPTFPAAAKKSEKHQRVIIRVKRDQKPTANT